MISKMTTRIVLSSDNKMSHDTREEFPYSEEKLVKAEKQILSTLNTPFKTFYVPIKLPAGSNEKIWTISFNTESKNTPILLIHGFAAGSCFWLLNFDALAKNRPVYALDIIGFGRSSRPVFEENGNGAEKQIVDSIEEWRKEMNLEKFILVGHSMGGYICTAYTLDYPGRVEHLVLCDPWGFSDRKAYPNLQIKAICYLYSKISPLDFLRKIGKLGKGPWWIKRTCDDIVDNYRSVLADRSIMANYIYHCNAQNPTGEQAFTTMVKKIGRARNPMIRRVNNLRENLPVTILYGTNTWMDKEMGTRIKEMRPNTFDVRYIDNAGHHIYSERAELFNEIVISVCDSVDQKNEDATNIGLNNEIKFIDDANGKNELDCENISVSKNQKKIENNNDTNEIGKEIISELYKKSDSNNEIIPVDEKKKSEMENGIISVHGKLTD